MAEISVEELKSRILSGSPLAVIDLREASSFADWSIPGSINLPVIESLRRDDPEPLRERTGELPTDRPLVMVCEVGISAGKASRILEPLGFQVTTLAGGCRRGAASTARRRCPCPEILPRP